MNNSLHYLFENNFAIKFSIKYVYIFLIIIILLKINLAQIKLLKYLIIKYKFTEMI